MAIPHITPEQVAQYGVVASPDRLTGKPADNKAVFDRLVRELVTAAVNNVIDQTNALLLTEAERTTNENGRTAAETSRVNAETLRVAAETARVNAETARVTAEDARVLAEKSRADTETARKTAETARVDAETARVAAEVLRVEAEKARATAETARANEEKTRGTAETARVTTEGTRKTQEDARQTAEQGRATNEAGRGTAEQNRAAAELLRAGAENTRSGAEETRKTAETNRALAEDGRVTAETARTGAEEARKTAENERAARDAADAVCEAYQPTHDYIVGNKVLYIGSTYRCIKPCRGVVPTAAANWMVFAEKGADGKGSGDMLASVYDKVGKRQDVFEFAEKKKAEAVTEAATDAKTKADTAEKNAKDASRPTSWTPSASDVGAAPSTHVGDSSHATTEEKLAWNGKAEGVHTHAMKDVTDLSYATKAEAEAGTDGTKLMSPLRVREAMEAHPSGCVLQITFAAAFAGRPYTVTAQGESYSGTVPAGMAVNVSVKNCRTTYTVEATTAAADKYSTAITTGDYFGQYLVRLVTFTATLKVATKAGAAVTAVSGGNRYTATADGTGVATLTIKQPGTYAVDAVLGGKTVSGSIAITTDGNTYNLKLPFISTILEENDWDTISQVSADGQGANYWKVGDKKKIVINGMAGKTNFSNLTIYPFILGFNHNAAVEGNGRISWQLGKNAAGDLIALVDSKYNGSGVTETGWFSMNGSNTNSGGWNGSQMCNTILGSHSVPTNPAPNTLLAALPPELRAVLKPCTKYRDNTGGNGDTASKVTATTEYLPLLSEFEYFGTRSYANSAEQSHQKQYDYFKAGNSKIFHRYDTPATAVYAWSGSVYAADATLFCSVSSNGGASSDNAYNAYAVPPSFCT